MHKACRGAWCGKQNRYLLDNMRPSVADPVHSPCISSHYAGVAAHIQARSHSNNDKGRAKQPTRGCSLESYHSERLQIRHQTPVFCKRQVFLHLFMRLWRGSGGQLLDDGSSRPGPGEQPQWRGRLLSVNQQRLAVACPVPSHAFCSSSDHDSSANPGQPSRTRALRPVCCSP
ncbi:hypothetical protein F5Y01DRAFT_118824 [Xylaria sp. FL0043]|nr:hypothetical protein F5Y01DRAFT_118824 [Xylaria sp. FL0043]